MVGALQPQGSDNVALSPSPWTTWRRGWCPSSSSHSDLASLGQSQTPVGELWGPMVSLSLQGS